MTADRDGMWIIGYGSLIFKPPPLYDFKVTGYLKGFIRRFWQSSSDHRGTPAFPGRVVTLIPLAELPNNGQFYHDLHRYELRHRPDFAIDELDPDDLKVWGCAYYIAPDHVEEMKQYLDVREQDGYTTHQVPFHIVENPQNGAANDVVASLPKNAKGDVFIESVIYIGTVHNESFVGPEELAQTARRIADSRGPSGENLEYLVELHKAVQDLSPHSRDYYLEDLVQLATSADSKKG